MGSGNTIGGGYGVELLINAPAGTGQPAGRGADLMNRIIAAAFRAAASFWQAVSFRPTVQLRAAEKAKAKPDTEWVSQEAGWLFDNYGNHVLRLAYSYLHNKSDAEEILQDTLIQYMKYVPSFESEEHEKAWLLRTAANLSKNRLEYQKIRRADELDEELIAEEREDLSFVWEAVRELPTAYREVIHLYYYEGYPVKEISKILNRNESTVRSDLRRGREKLKQVLKEAYDFE